MDMMHTQAVGVAPTPPTLVSAVRSGNGNNRRYTITFRDNSKNETAFVIERRRAGSNDAWSTLATVQSGVFGVVPYVNSGVGVGTGNRTYIDPIGNTSTQYQYQVYAINVIGDIWDYSNPGFNEIAPGGGWPTLTLSSRQQAAQPPVPPTAVSAPSNLVGTAVARNKKVADVTLIWRDNSNNETGFLVQRADNVAFTAGVVNATVTGNVTTLSQSVARGKTFYYLRHQNIPQTGTILNKARTLGILFQLLPQAKNCLAQRVNIGGTG
ncbi:MAG: hypothetical protein Kow0031_09670 [Anaerolineae bacterium]